MSPLLTAVPPEWVSVPPLRLRFVSWALTRPSPSTSVKVKSLLAKLSGTSSPVLTVWSVATGTSFTAVTVIKTNWLMLFEPPFAVPPESVTLNWNPVVPVQLAAGLNWAPRISAKVYEPVVTRVVPSARNTSPETTPGIAVTV